MNIQSAIIKGTNILKNKSINSAKLDSEILLASVIDKDRKYLILNNDQIIKEKNLKHFQKHKLYLYHLQVVVDEVNHNHCL